MGFLERFTDGLDSTIHSLHNPTALTIADGMLFLSIIKEPHHEFLVNLWKAIKGLHDFVIGIVYLAGLVYSSE